MNQVSEVAEIYAAAEAVLADQGEKVVQDAAHSYLDSVRRRVEAMDSEVQKGSYAAVDTDVDDGPVWWLRGDREREPAWYPIGCGPSVRVPASVAPKRSSLKLRSSLTQLFHNRPGGVRQI